MKKDASFIGGMIDGFQNRIKAAEKGSLPKAFDWEQCAKIILEKHNQFETARAGLAEDWALTNAIIFKNGEIIENTDENVFPYFYSDWATPILDLDGEEIECWTENIPNDFDDKKLWTEESKKILEEKIKQK